MQFARVVAASDVVAATPARLGKIACLADVFRDLAPDEIEPVVALMAGRPRQGRIGIGHAAIAAASAVTPAEHASLTVGDVDAAFEVLARISGTGAAAARSRELRSLFARATSAEHDFLRRALYGELRHGALEGVVLEAVARAADITPDRIRRAVLMSGSLPGVARAALTEGARALDAMVVQVMRPVRPMLAASATDVTAALTEQPDAALEYKLDGARVQIHKDGEDVAVFSRTLNDVTASVPEILALARTLPTRSLILDGEVIALRPDGTPHPFQTTMRRFGRVREVEQLQSSLPLTLFAFDALLVDDAPLIDEPLDHRIAALNDLAGRVSVPRVLRPTASEAEQFVRAALDRGHEGVMAKALASSYEAGRRGSAWLKVKQARTLDLVVLAAEWGHGRRRGWLSNLHLGARDPSTNAFVMLGKTFKGMTDEMLAWQTQRLLSLEIARDGIVVYVTPELVVEIAFNEIQDSPVYPGGLALRFARVKRYRLDKTAADANTIDDVRGMQRPSLRSTDR